MVLGKLFSAGAKALTGNYVGAAQDVIGLLSGGKSKKRQQEVRYAFDPRVSYNTTQNPVSNSNDKYAALFKQGNESIKRAKELLQFDNLSVGSFNMGGVGQNFDSNNFLNT